MSKIKEFIKENNIEFNEGQRNSSVTTIIGYALHLGLNQEELEEELADKIEGDEFIQDELDRLFSYCNDNDYDKYWKTKEASSTWKF